MVEIISISNTAFIKNLFFQSIKPSLSLMKIIPFCRRCGPSRKNWKMNSKAINIKTVILFLLPLLILSGCSSFPFYPGARQVLTSPQWKEQLPHYEFLPGNIEVEADLHQKEISRNALLNLNLLLEEKNQENPESRTQKVAVSLYLREYAFMKNFKPQKSLTLHILVKDQEGTELGSSYFSTESKDSFYSSSYLFKELKKGCGSLF